MSKPLIPQVYYAGQTAPPRYSRWLYRADAFLNVVSRHLSLSFGMTHTPAPIQNLRSLSIPDGAVAICHDDTAIGGVRFDDSGFLFKPFGECIISDTHVPSTEWQ